jgi:hydrogenase maturation protease
MSADVGGEAPHALVIGIGNALRGDDGIGPAVIEALRPESEGLTLIESSGNDLLEWLTSDAFDRAIVVDAADLGRAPGSWARLTPAHLSADSTQGLTHGMGLAQSLELAATLGLPYPPISIYAVQPASIGWTPELSRQAAGVVPAVAAAIRQELSRPEPTRRPLTAPSGARTDLPPEQDVRSLSSGANTT